MKEKYRRGVFMLVYRKDNDQIHYLLLKRKLHWKGWEFPKGGIEKREFMRKAIAREIKEETGQIPIKIKKFPLFGKYKYHKLFKDREPFIGQTFSLYSIELKSKKIKVDAREHSTFQWATFKQALKKLTWSNQRKSLRMVNRSLTNKKT